MVVNFSTSDFYALTKLELWSKGYVVNLGFVQQIKTIPGVDVVYNGKTFRSIESYKKSLFVLRPLCSGLYLLDVVQISQSADKNVFMVVIGVARFGLANKEKILYFRIENGASLQEFKENSFTDKTVSRTKMILKKNTLSSRRRHSGSIYSYSRRY